MRFMFLLPLLFLGGHSYEDFQAPGKCMMCHKEIYDQWQQSLMSKSFTHHWDEVEYFDLALPQSLALEKVAGVKAGCISCHAPLAYLAGDIPPSRPSAGTRANEGVSCDLCHIITGSTEKEPFNGSYIVSPGKVKYGNRHEKKRSTFHEQAYSEFTTKSELCACCHDEQSPYGAWVKTTYREWKAGPHAAEGVRCHDCHMHRAPGKSAGIGAEHADVAHHNFHGAHFESKLSGAVDLAVYPNKNKLGVGKSLKVRVHLFNGKAGHMIPSGSAEERMLWLEVTAVDAGGQIHRLPVKEKGFEGEEYTIADPEAMAYQAMGEIKGMEGFEGVARDGDVPAGSRIFRKPYFDPKGRMTICQWYTAENEKIDYRIGPRQTRIETYEWKLPAELPPGALTLEARLYYSLVPTSVGAFLGLEEEETRRMKVNEARAVIEVM